MEKRPFSMHSQLKQNRPISEAVFRVVSKHSTGGQDPIPNQVFQSRFSRASFGGGGCQVFLLVRNNYIIA